MVGRVSRGTRRSVAALAVAALMLLSVGGAGADDGDRDDDGEPGPLAQEAGQTTYGWVLVPTLEPMRSYSPMSGNGVTFQFVTVTPDAPFALEGQRAGSSVCVLAVCVRTDDFDLVFFHERDNGQATSMERHSHVGNEGGRVPLEADFALVFLRTPGLQPAAKGFGFVYIEGEPAGDVLPDVPL